MGKIYEFTVTIIAEGDNAADAWNNCKVDYDINFEEMPSYVMVKSDHE